MSVGSKNFLLVVVAFLLSGLITFGVIFGVDKIVEMVNNSEQAQDTTPTEPTPPDPEPEPGPQTKEVDFQPVVDAWAKTVGGNKSILIYDLDLGKEIASYNVEEDYNTASLYKLFVVYEGYKRLQNGTWDGDTRAGSTGKTISKCLDLAIRESHSPCAETLWSMIGHTELDTIIKNSWGITNSDISHLTSNVGDIMRILKRFYEHPDFNDTELLDVMWDSFLNQPDTTYEWRQGLPRGFAKAEVYNKVGWAYNADGKYWNIYHDAAIVKFPQEDGTIRSYIIIVMTNKIDFTDIRRLGRELEAKFYEN
ncbi:serine hydrolase [Candidatus Saccharibacteria bacterium]|nr:serine hydrolase [Candidatus Saccharibacteria bacterium]